MSVADQIVDSFNASAYTTDGYVMRSVEFVPNASEETLQFALYSDMTYVKYPEFDMALDDVSVVLA